jgi:hypothetical protein
MSINIPKDFMKTLYDKIRTRSYVKGKAEIKNNIAKVKIQQKVWKIKSRNQNLKTRRGKM